MTFQIPEGYKDAALYSIKDGVAAKLESTVSGDGKTITADVAALGDFAICGSSEKKAGAVDNADNNNQQKSDNNMLWIIIAVIALLIAGAIAAVILVKKKKSNSPEKPGMFES